jgi:hypothetical protein
VGQRRVSQAPRRPVVGAVGNPQGGSSEQQSRDGQGPGRQ